MRTCPKGHAIEGTHKFCGECGAPLLMDEEMTDEELVEDVRRELQREKKSTFSTRRGWVIVGAIAVVAVILGAVGAGDDEDGPDDFDAFYMCQEFVKDRLKAPSTAKFRNLAQDDGEVVVIGSGVGPYTVRSSVDSQNGFGAMIRNDFTCTVTYTGDEMWRLDGMDLGS